MKNKTNQISDNFYKSIHFWGRLTVGVALLCTLLIPLYLTFVLGHYPNAADIISGLIAIAGFVGVIWFVEPISYFPVLGPSGTYMVFLSGNIGNMRVPVVTATQDALNIEPGSEKSEVAGIFAIISSTFTNLLILAIVLIGGQTLINALPANVVAAFNYALPGVLGAMVVMLGSKVELPNLIALIIIALATMVFIYFSPNFLPANIAQLIGSADTGIVAIFGIIYSISKARKDHAEAKA